MVGISVVTENLSDTAELYERYLELKPIDKKDDSALNTRSISYDVGDTNVEILSPNGEGRIKDIMDSMGGGPLTITVRVDDISKTRSFLEERNVEFESVPDESEGFLVPAISTYGVQILFTEAE